MEAYSRTVSPQNQPEDLDHSLRPQQLSDYIGQAENIANLKVFMQAAKQRQEPLDHVLLSGPPGLGKTTLAQLIAVEMGVNITATSAPAIERPIDLLILLNALQPYDVLFIDEIHRLSRVVEEILYPAMEDLSFDRILNKGAAAGAVRHKIAPFTLIGATTKQGALSAPLRSRFGIPMQLDFYSHVDLAAIVRRSAALLNTPIDDSGCLEIAKRCRGTPRIANRLIKRVRDFAQVQGDAVITAPVAGKALDRLAIDECGLDRTDRRILSMLVERYNGNPVGLSTLAAAVQEEADNLEEVYEPYLLAEGFIVKTPRGRQAAQRAYEHLGLAFQPSLPNN